MNIVFEWRSGSREKAECKRNARVRKVARVAPFRGSSKEVTRGTVPIVQSQHRSQGNSSSQVFRLTR